MNKLYFIMIFIIRARSEETCSADGLCEGNTGPGMTDSNSEKNCLRHNEFEAAGQCILARYKEGIYDQPTTAALMGELMKRLQSNSALYSIGVTTGTDPTIIVGKQNHYTFDQSMEIRIKLWETASKDILFQKAVATKTILVYTEDNLELTHLPELGNGYMMPMTPTKTPNFFKHPEAKGGPIKPGCENFAKWNQRETTKKGVLVINMPSDYWCPDTAQADFEVWVAKMVNVKKGKKSIWVREWSISRLGAHGMVPESMKTFF